MFLSCVELLNSHKRAHRRTDRDVTMMTRWNTNAFSFVLGSQCQWGSPGKQAPGPQLVSAGLNQHTHTHRFYFAETQTRWNTWMSRGQLEYQALFWNWQNAVERQARWNRVRGDGKHVKSARTHSHTHTPTQKKWGSQERCLRGEGLTYGQQTTVLGGAGCV